MGTPWGTTIAKFARLRAWIRPWGTERLAVPAISRLSRRAVGCGRLKSIQRGRAGPTGARSIPGGWRAYAHFKPVWCSGPEAGSVWRPITRPRVSGRLWGYGGWLFGSRSAERPAPGLQWWAAGLPCLYVREHAPEFVVVGLRGHIHHRGNTRLPVQVAVAPRAPAGSHPRRPVVCQARPPAPSPWWRRKGLSCRGAVSGGVWARWR